MVIASASPIKIDDIVELLPTNEENRQLRKDKKIAWTVVVAAAWPQCFGGKEGVLIECTRDKKHNRWVEPGDISLLTYAESRFRD